MRAFGRETGSSPRGIPASLTRSSRGAVYVEFLAVFFPLLTFFLGLVQMGFLQSAILIVQHSAMRAVRTGVVVAHDNPDYYSGEQEGSIGSQKRKLIEDAARIHLATLGDAQSAQIKLQNSYAWDAQMEVTVEYQYTCRVPLGRVIACGADGRRKIIGAATLPVHGARYRY
jgi:hypothetical protein